MNRVDLRGLGWDAAHESTPNAQVSYDPLKPGALRLEHYAGCGPLVQTGRSGADIAAGSGYHVP